MCKPHLFFGIKSPISQQQQLCINRYGIQFTILYSNTQSVSTFIENLIKSLDAVGTMVKTTLPQENTAELVRATFWPPMTRQTWSDLTRSHKT